MSEINSENRLEWIEPDEIEYIAENSQRFMNQMMIYRCAIREVRTKLEVLDDEFSINHKRNPIVSIRSRVKKPQSIIKKLKREEFPVTLESMVENLSDIAGIRVTCAFIDDIYYVARLLAVQDDVKVLKVKDYIQAPKTNGYRSYHMIVEIPVFFSRMTEHVRVEVQIRTMAMDFWASLEHQIRYKKQIDEGADLENISQELMECAEIIAQTDIKMQNIKEMIGEFSDIG